MQLRREKEVRARLGSIACITCEDLILDRSRPLSFTFDLQHLVRATLEKNTDAYARYFHLDPSLPHPYRSLPGGQDLHDSTVVIIADGVAPVFEKVIIVREKQQEQMYHGFPDLYLYNFLFPYRLQQEVLEGVPSYLLEVKCSSTSGGRHQLDSYHQKVLGKERPCIKLLFSIGQTTLERVGKVSYLPAA